VHLPTRFKKLTSAVSKEQREEFANDPEKFYAFRKVIEDDGNTSTYLITP
jgi:hypothetical protein